MREKKEKKTKKKEDEDEKYYSKTRLNLFHLIWRFIRSKLLIKCPTNL